MLPKARNETEEGFVTGETLVLEKTCRIKEAADFLVDSYKEINKEYQNSVAVSTATNMRLQAKLAESETNATTLKTRNAELRCAVDVFQRWRKELEQKAALSSQEKDGSSGRIAGKKAEGRQRAKNTNKNRDETVSSDEASLEEWICLIENDAAASVPSTISLEKFQRLHRVCSSITGKYNELQAKYTTVRKENVSMKQKLRELYKEQKQGDDDAANKEGNPRGEDTGLSHEDIEGLRANIKKLGTSSKSHLPADQKENLRVEDTADQKERSRDEDTTPFGNGSKISNSKELRPRDGDAAPSQKSSKPPQTELQERVPVATREKQTEDKDKDREKPNNGEKEDSDSTENEETLILTKISKKYSKLPHNDSKDIKPELCARWQRPASNEGTTDVETTTKRDRIPFDWVSFFTTMFCFVFTCINTIDSLTHSCTYDHS
jgi:hypothetical protein